MPTTSRPSGPPTARDLAEAFMREWHATGDPDQRNTIRAIVLAAGELIASRGYSGCWTTLDPAELLDAIPTATRTEHTELCFCVIGFAAWLASHLYIDPDRPITTAAAVLASGTTDPDLIALCERILSDPRSIPFEE